MATLGHIGEYGKRWPLDRCLRGSPIDDRDIPERGQRTEGLILMMAGGVKLRSIGPFSPRRLAKASRHGSDAPMLASRGRSRKGTENRADGKNTKDGMRYDMNCNTNLH